MSDFEKKIEQLFLDKEKVIDSNILENIIKNFSEQMVKESDQTDDVPQISDSDIFKFLPKFDFREAQLGTIDTTTRKEFQALMSKQLQNKKTLEEKIKYLQDFTLKPSPDYSTEEILSNLILLKTLENIIRQSTSSAGGFQIEALLAGLFATGEQIRTDIQRKAVDVTIEGVSYQVKLISQTRSLDMTISTTRNYFVINKDVLRFIVFQKYNNEALDVYRYNLTRSTFNKILKHIKDTSSKPLDEIDTFTIPKNLFASGFIGTVGVNKEVFDDYSSALKNNIKLVLKNTADLINNINRFYIKNDTRAASKGRANAVFISQNLKK